MIRAVTKADAPRLIEIYSYYVKNTLISAEYEVPTVEEFERRIESTTQKFPYFCIEEDGRILGYAYANPFHWREAFKYDADLSISTSRLGGTDTAAFSTRLSKKS